MFLSLRCRVFVTMAFQIGGNVSASELAVPVHGLRIPHVSRRPKHLCLFALESGDSQGFCFVISSVALSSPAGTTGQALGMNAPTIDCYVRQPLSHILRKQTCR